jgi:hypothetical protein
MCTVPLPPGVNPVAANKYIDIKKIIKTFNIELEIKILLGFLVVRHGNV